jgi:hypothetical protein
LYASAFLDQAAHCLRHLIKFLNIAVGDPAFSRGSIAQRSSCHSPDLLCQLDQLHAGGADINAKLGAG